MTASVYFHRFFMVNDFQGIDFKVRQRAPLDRLACLFPVSKFITYSFVLAQMLACAAVFLALKVVEAPRQGKVPSQLWPLPSCCSARSSSQQIIRCVHERYVWALQPLKKAYHSCT